MKNTFFPALTALLLLAFNLTFAQKTSRIIPKSTSDIPRCGTMEEINQRMLTNPAFKKYMDKAAADYRASLTNVSLRTGQTSRLTSLAGPVLIPVVVHIVLPNPSIITDDAVAYFINRLNLDFSGLNPDSINAIPFFGVRGHSLLRFVLARRDPSGNFTTGIIRKTGTTLIEESNPQPIKNSATTTGGSTGWDVTQYYNLYVGDGGGQLLGISPEIGAGGPAGSSNADGVCIDYRAFSNSCFADGSFNMARTAVHEIGHNFGLLHIFEGGCAAINDFQQLTTPLQNFPPELLAPADDTPVQANATSGCPTTGTPNGCSPAIPKMFQNFMDYTNDLCYSMFTDGQVARMEYLLENFRPGYLTTLGAQYPAAMPTLDAAVAGIVSPGGRDFIAATCTSISYSTPVCPGTIVPRLNIVNSGTTTITSITVSVKIGAAAAVTQTVAVNIPVAKSQTVTLTAQAIPEGSSLITFTTSLPNGAADQNTANDVASITVNIPPAALPVTQNFETALLPSGWSIFNPNLDNTWIRATPGAGGTGTWAAAIDNFSGDGSNAGHSDDLRTSRISNAGLLPTDSLLIVFDLAHKQYPDALDRLQVLVSKDCGATFIPVYSKAGPTLATAGTSSNGYGTPIPSDWRKERISIGNDLFGAGPIIVAFRNTSDWGNVIWLDNINITRKASKDLVATAILRPNSTECASTFAPALTVQNASAETVTSFKAGYIINNGTPVINTYNVTLAGSGGATTVTFPVITPPPGTYTVKLFVAEPVTSTPGPDGTPANDTITRTVYAIATLPSISETFEGSGFVPAGWGLSNPDRGLTWEKATVGRSSGGSAAIRNFINTSFGQKDELYTPILDYTGVDSVKLSFDLSATTRRQADGVIAMDTLEVLVTRDCGASFTTVYKKWGASLQTVGGSSNYASLVEFLPLGITHWRKETIDLTAFRPNGPLQVVFRNTTNNQNNIYIDNVNLSARILPPNLKQAGYVVLPNPSSDGLYNLWYVQAPTNLAFINVLNSLGQTVWKKEYSGNTSNVLPIDLSGKPAGVYVVNVGYVGGGGVRIRVIKQ